MPSSTSIANQTDYVPTQQGFFPSTDGTMIYYETAGHGPPLLFCYGLVCRREHWRYQLNHFCRNYQVILYDYRGHQRSECPANRKNLTLHWCAEDGRALLRHLNIREVVVLGHSMGVAVAALIAQRQPLVTGQETPEAHAVAELVRGLVLICGTVTNPFDGMFNSNRMMTVYQGMAYLYQLHPRFMSVFWKRVTELNRLNIFLTSRIGFNPYLSSEEDVLRYMEGVNQTPLEVFFKLVSDYVAFDGREGLRNILCPTQVIAGNDDRITPILLQEEMVRLIQKGELEKIPMGSHNAHTDIPEMVNEKIELFLKRQGYT